MPSKEDLLAMEPTSGELDDLVRRIGDSLRLKAAHKQRAGRDRMAATQRASPYALPLAKSGSVCKKSPPRNARRLLHRRCDSDDPYAMLQELLRSGNLIKEAVKRLGNRGETDRTREARFDSNCDSPVSELSEMSSDSSDRSDSR
ncbi:GSK-3-binding protein-like [Branchiostoma lanceolatum]|uniref:GSK-3-binding protein-like n=1 Tax=Branchiostoma lanceolatum TaxID=7740 RepID=UPI003455F854